MRHDALSRVIFARGTTRGTATSVNAPGNITVFDYKACIRAASSVAAETLPQRGRAAPRAVYKCALTLAAIVKLTKTAKTPERLANHMPNALTTNTLLGPIG